MMNFNEKEARKLVSSYDIKDFSFEELKRALTENDFFVYEFKSNDAKKLLETIPKKEQSNRCFLYNKKGIRAVFYNSEKNDSFSECFQLAVMLCLIECEDTRTCKRRKLIDAAMVATYMSEILALKSRNSSQKVKRTKAVCLTVLLSLVVLSVTALIITHFVLGRGFEDPFENNRELILTDKSDVLETDEEKEAALVGDITDFDFENNNITTQKVEDDIEASYLPNEEDKNATIDVDDYSGSGSQASKSDNSATDAGKYKTNDAESTDDKKESSQVQEASSENVQNDDEEKMYLVTKSGKKYHVEGCRFVSDPSKCVRISSKSEKFSNYEPCKVCINDENDVK